MKKFGFAIAQPRSLDFDSLNREKAQILLEKVPSLRLCIGCGACTASCTAGQFTDFNIRRAQTLFRRGEYSELDEKLRACMLCGKCMLLCPRGVNTRALIIEMRRLLNE